MLINQYEYDDMDREDREAELREMEREMAYEEREARWWRQASPEHLAALGAADQERARAFRAQWDAMAERIEARAAVAAQKHAEQERQRREWEAYVATFTPAEWCRRFVAPTPRQE